MLIGLAAAATVHLDQKTFPVHEKVSVQLVVTAGEEGLNVGDRLRIEEPVFHGMRWAKWGYLQTDPTRCTARSEDTDKPSAGLVRAEAQGLELALRHSVDGPGLHQEGVIEVEVLSGSLQEGGELVVQLGVSENDCGWQTSDRALERIPLLTTLNDEFIGAPELSFAPRLELAEILQVLPSQGLVGEQLELRSIELDAWGNALSVSLESVSFDQPGVYRVGESNPLRITEEPPELQVYWGDLHTHHGHSWFDELGAWVDANHSYSRDVLAYDFGCESVKAYPTELRYEELWERVQRSCREYSGPDYVALLGFEWMGGRQQGHHNVYYDGCSAPLGPQSLETLETGLWPYIQQVMDETGLRAVTVPHAPSHTGYNWESRDDALRPLVEVYSEWGSSMDPSLPGSVPEALSRGHRLGFIASSDNHDGWLGNRFAAKNSAGGLAAILAPELSAPALLTAMAERSTYATTGARILLDLSSTPQGTDTLFEWQVAGTDLIREVHLMVSGVGAAEPAAALHTWYPGTLDAEGSYLLPWGPRELAVWLEVGQADRHQAWSSPRWVERREVEPRGCFAVPLLGGFLLPLIVLFRWRS